MNFIRISSSPNSLRSGEELFNLKNKVLDYKNPSQVKGDARDCLTLASCDVTSGVAKISTFEQFYTGHDDSEIVILIQDENGNTLWEWAFDLVMGTGAELEAEKLLVYLEKKFDCPVSRAGWFC